MITLLLSLARRLPRGLLARIARPAHAICSLTPYHPPSLKIEDESSDGLEVRPSRIPSAGNGLFATKRFTEDEPICAYLGVTLTLGQWLRTPDWTYCLGVNPTIDAGPYPNVLARYVNHHFDATKVNCQFERLEGRGRWIVATRTIEPGEELYADYGEFYWAFFRTHGVSSRLLSPPGANDRRPAGRGSAADKARGIRESRAK